MVAGATAAVRTRHGRCARTRGALHHTLWLVGTCDLVNGIKFLSLSGPGRRAAGITRAESTHASVAEVWLLCDRIGAVPVLGSLGGVLTAVRRCARSSPMQLLSRNSNAAMKTVELVRIRCLYYVQLIQEKNLTHSASAPEVRLVECGHCGAGNNRPGTLGDRTKTCPVSVRTPLRPLGCTGSTRKQEIRRGPPSI